MAAVLVVALLLLCGNVQSAEEALMAFVTQVRRDESNVSSTAPAMAPAITTTPGDSGATHTAVLSSQTEIDKSELILVDLARADEEKMINMTSASAPSPSEEVVPEGFDKIEAEDPATEEEAPGPESADPAAPGPESAYSFASEDQGTLVSDVDDTSYPNISGDEDNSHKAGYGVRTTSLDSNTTGDSFSTHGADSAISTTPGDSDATHAAVLSSQTEIDKSELILVDLARADEEKMINMTSASAPPPSEEMVPEGFDMLEAEGPSTEEEAPGPESADPAAPGPESAYSFASQEQGTLVSDVDDTSYPNISGDEDNSHKAGYGVQTTSLDADTTDDSFSSHSGDPADSDGDQGTLVSDVDDTSYPNISGDEDNSHKPGYGVRTTSLDADTTGDSFSSHGGDPADSDGDQGTLVSDVDDTSYPNISGDEDNSHKPGYGVRTTSLDADTTGDSFSSHGGDPADSDGDQGTLVSDVDDTSYPNISGDEDNSHKPGYGVRTTSLDAETTGDSFSSHGGDPADSDGDQGTLVSDVDDTSYPNISGDEDNSHKPGYGVRTTSLDADTTGDSFSSHGGDPADSDGDQGTLVSDVDDTSYPNISGDEDNSHKPGYGVRTTSLDADTTGDSFSSHGRDPADSDGDQGTLVSDVDDTSFSAVSETQDFSDGKGYGVNNSPGEDDKATTQDETVSENGTSETTGFTLRQSRTYTSPPESKKASWGKGKCTFYGGMDASGTMSGACGYGNLYASGYGAYTVALSSALFKNGMACGACYEVACSGNGKSCKPGSVLVTVTNFCPPNPGRSANNGGWCNGANQHFDLSYPAFTKIADPKAGAVDLDYRRVPCKKKGGIRFTLNGNCNFNVVTITNVGGSGVVTEAYMKGDGMDWAPMARNWGANWQCSRNYCGKGISIKIVTSDNKVSVSRLAGKDWAFGKTYIGQQV